MTAPLSERIVVDPEPRLPEGPAHVVWRRASAADAPVIAELAVAMAAEDHPEWADTEEDIAEELAHDWVDLAVDTALAEADGELVAYGIQVASPAAETFVRSLAYGGVRPSHRGQGIGRALLDWQRHRARQQLANSHLALPGWHIVHLDEKNTSGRRLVERAGIPAARWFSSMTRPLGAEIPDAALPEGLRLATPTQEHAAALLEARNDAFRDHWGSQPRTESEWASMMSGSTLRLDLSAIALDGDRVVGFVLVEVNAADFERQGATGGYIQLVGVVRDHRRRGIAPALLAEVLRRHREAGYEQIVLDVDSENPTGALALYTGMGFVPGARSTTFVEEF